MFIGSVFTIIVRMYQGDTCLLACCVWSSIVVWNAIVMPWWHCIALLGSAAASLEAPKLHPRAMAGLWAGCCMGVGVSQARRGRRLGVRHAVVLASSLWALVASTGAPRLDPRARESCSMGLGVTPARRRRRAVIRRVVASGSSMAVAASG